MGKCYMDQMVNVKNLSTGILILMTQKSKVTTSNHSGAKGLPFCIQKWYFIIQEENRGRKEGLNNFLKCNRCHLTCVLNIVTLLLYYEIYIGSTCKVQN